MRNWKILLCLLALAFCIVSASKGSHNETTKTKTPAKIHGSASKEVTNPKFKEFIDAKTKVPASSQGSGSNGNAKPKDSTHSKSKENTHVKPKDLVNTKAKVPDTAHGAASKNNSSTKHKDDTHSKSKENVHHKSKENTHAKPKDAVDIKAKVPTTVHGTGSKNHTKTKSKDGTHTKSKEDTQSKLKELKDSINKKANIHVTAHGSGSKEKTKSKDNTNTNSKTNSKNPLGGMNLHYLIGHSKPGSGTAGTITEVGYGHNKPVANGISIGYCNLFDEIKGKHGPYLKPTTTSSNYNEGVIDPKGPGWKKNLHEQFSSRQKNGFKYIELDNPDAYNVKNVLGAVDMAKSYGLGVVAKNPLAMKTKEDAKKYVAHPNIYGIIVEKDDYVTPAKLDELRKAAGKPDLPVWFVGYGNGKKWAEKMAGSAKDFKNMGVTYSTKGEYDNAQDLHKPKHL